MRPAAPPPRSLVSSSVSVSLLPPPSSSSPRRKVLLQPLFSRTRASSLCPDSTFEYYLGLVFACLPQDRLALFSFPHSRRVVISVFPGLMRSSVDTPGCIFRCRRVAVAAASTTARTGSFSFVSLEHFTVGALSRQKGISLLTLWSPCSKFRRWCLSTSLPRASPPVRSHCTPSLFLAVGASLCSLAPTRNR